MHLIELRYYEKDRRPVETLLNKHGHFTRANPPTDTDAGRVLDGAYHVTFDPLASGVLANLAALGVPLVIYSGPLDYPENSLHACCVDGVLHHWPAGFQGHGLLIDFHLQSDGRYHGDHDCTELNTFVSAYLTAHHLLHLPQRTQL